MGVSPSAAPSTAIQARGIALTTSQPGAGAALAAATGVGVGAALGARGRRGRRRGGAAATPRARPARGPAPAGLRRGALLGTARHGRGRGDRREGRGGLGERRGRCGRRDGGRLEARQQQREGDAEGDAGEAEGGAERRDAERAPEDSAPARGLAEHDDLELRAEAAEHGARLLRLEGDGDAALGGGIVGEGAEHPRALGAEALTVFHEEEGPRRLAADLVEGAGARGAEGRRPSRGRRRSGPRGRRRGSRGRGGGALPGARGGRRRARRPRASRAAPRRPARRASRTRRARARPAEVAGRTRGSVPHGAPWTFRRPAVDPVRVSAPLPPRERILRELPGALLAALALRADRARLRRRSSRPGRAAASACSRPTTTAPSATCASSRCYPGGGAPVDVPPELQHEELARARASERRRAPRPRGGARPARRPRRRRCARRCGGSSSTATLQPACAKARRGHLAARRRERRLRSRAAPQLARGRPRSAAALVRAHARPAARRPRPRRARGAALARRSGSACSPSPLAARPRLALLGQPRLPVGALVPRGRLRAREPRSARPRWRTRRGACVGLTFLFATLWKLALSPDFVDGRFFRVTLLTDARFENLAVLAGGHELGGLGAQRRRPRRAAHLADAAGGERPRRAARAAAAGDAPHRSSPARSRPRSRPRSSGARAAALARARRAAPRSSPPRPSASPRCAASAGC